MDLAEQAQNAVLDRGLDVLAIDPLTAELRW
jgi:hypothetical protein